MKRFHLKSSLAVILTLAVVLALQSPARAAITATPKGQKAAPIIATHRLLITFPGKGQRLDPNPNHLPNLAPGIGGGIAECAYYYPQTCQQACSSIIVTTLIGVKNTTAYPISGTIEVLLQTMSGNTVRRWTVNGLAANGQVYTGKIKVPFYCVPAGTYENHSPNYALIVKAPPGVTELDPNDNRAEMYLRPTATISP
jgi:hypothetical protein